MFTLPATFNFAGEMPAAWAGPVSANADPAPFAWLGLDPVSAIVGWCTISAVVDVPLWVDVELGSPDVTISAVVDVSVWVEIGMEALMDSVRLGDTARIRFTVNGDSGRVDPDELDVWVMDPNKVETKYVYPGANITRTLPGVFVLEVDIPLTAKVGLWNCRSQAVGSLKGTGVFKFDVVGLYAE